MPTGVIINASAVLLGGIFGGFFGNRLSEDFKEKLNMIFGACSMGMGIYSIAPMKNMPAVIFAVILGTIVGLLIHLGSIFNKGAVLMQKPITRMIPTENLTISHQEFVSLMVTATVLFCASGTGIYGSLAEGMSGDLTILVSKSILDFFTAAIFAASLGYAVSIIAIPQLIIFVILFYLANFIIPFTNSTMIFDFKACGGFLMLATGFRMVKLKMFPIAEMIPAMILVMPLSWLWMNVITPLIH
ncbi:putative membrane protein YqgA involved in biofilm formation [Lactobacillus colini]|uniref:Membrane protein YqgA involved in biofilm formation n=1 Tax=Lactobacillus colini TaxID=1819254 RepID=A0ABS4MG62_9LACO|nr:DUF554 domain-containing protein [Lactobacillus colini]MBP2058653.1 putative membrane protein YqgA involved in biofilm formation [Lactobacillus colini]